MTNTQAAAQIEALVEQLTRQFFDELPDRLQHLENCIHKLSEDPRQEDLFFELYRSVHSLKGAAGTYNAMIMTRICHHMENALNAFKEVSDTAAVNETVETLYRHLDWLHLAYNKIREGDRIFTEIEGQLAEFDRVRNQKRVVALIVEPSATLRQICVRSLSNLPVDITLCEDGYLALGLALNRQFDLVITGMRLPSLNANALAGAISTQSGGHQKPLVIALASSPDNSPVPLGIDQVLTRDAKAFEQLQAIVQSMLKKKSV